MSTYIIRQKPSRSEEIEKNERPVEEIAENIRGNRRALTAWGGWSIGTCWKKIQPGDRLLFYRSEEPSGFFAVGRALPANDSICCQLRREGLLARFENKPGVDKFEPVDPERLAAFQAVSWETGEWGKHYYINAEWDVVADPNMAGHILVPFHTRDLGPGHKPSGHHISDAIAEKICAKCEEAANALRANNPPR